MVPVYHGHNLLVPALGITRLTFVLSPLITIRTDNKGHTMHIGCTWLTQVMAIRTRPGRRWTRTFCTDIRFSEIPRIPTSSLVRGGITVSLRSKRSKGNYDSVLDEALISDLHLTSAVGAVSLSAVATFRL